MTVVGFSSTDHLINLLHNGGFELVDTEDIPFWSVTGNYSLVVPDTGPSRAVQFTLATVNSGLLEQSFLMGDGNVLDFSRPLFEDTRASLPEGYTLTHSILLPHKTLFTLSASIRVKQGQVSCSIVGDDIDGSGDFAFTYDGPSSVVVSEGSWIRISIRFSMTKSPSKIGLKIDRTSTANLSVVDVSHIALYQGSYENASYTGNLLARCIPSNAIILCLGSVCPPGFADIGDDGTPPAAWLAQDPFVKARKGNFPRTAPGLTGSPTHTTDTPGFTPKTPNIEIFEGFDSKVALTEDGTTSGDSINTSIANPPTDIPDESGLPTHSHTLVPAGSRPTAVAFRFCKRL